MNFQVISYERAAHFRTFFFTLMLSHSDWNGQLIFSLSAILFSQKSYQRQGSKKDRDIVAKFDAKFSLCHFQNEKCVKLHGALV